MNICSAVFIRAEHLLQASSGLGPENTVVVAGLARSPCLQVAY